MGFKLDEFGHGWVAFPRPLILLVGPPIWDLIIQTCVISGQRSQHAYLAEVVGRSIRAWIVRSSTANARLSALLTPILNESIHILCPPLHSPHLLPIRPPRRLLPLLNRCLLIARWIRRLTVAPTLSYSKHTLTFRQFPVHYIRMEISHPFPPSDCRVFPSISLEADNTDNTSSGTVHGGDEKDR